MNRFSSSAKETYDKTSYFSFDGNHHSVNQENLKIKKLKI